LARATSFRCLHLLTQQAGTFSRAAGIPGALGLFGLGGVYFSPVLPIPAMTFFCICPGSGIMDGFYGYLNRSLIFCREPA